MTTVQTTIAAADDLLVYWNFDHLEQDMVKDLSGNGLDGKVGAGCINHLWRNVFYQCGMVARRTANIDRFENGVFEEDPGFVDAGNGNFRLRRDASLFQTMCFKPVPFDRIGLYEIPDGE